MTKVTQNDYSKITTAIEQSSYKAQAEVDWATSQAKKVPSVANENQLLNAYGALYNAQLAAAKQQAQLHPQGPLHQAALIAEFELELSKGTDVFVGGELQSKASLEEAALGIKVVNGEPTIDNLTASEWQSFAQSSYDASAEASAQGNQQGAAASLKEAQGAEAEAELLKPFQP